MKNAKSAKWIGLVVAIFVLVGSWAILQWNHQDKEDLLLSGMVEVREIPVSPRISGRIMQMKLEEGDQVQAGQTIALIASPELEAKVEAAQGQLQSASARLHLAQNGARSEEIRQAQAGWEASRQQRLIAETTSVRMQKLLGQKAIAQQQYDEANARYQSLLQQELAAKAKYDQAQNGARAEDLDAAKGQEQAALKMLQEAQSWRSEATLVSPIAGTIQKRYAGTGELVAPGLPVVVLIQTQEAWVQLPVREDLLKNFHLGQVLKAEIPGLGLQNVEFKVTWIAPMGDYATWRSTARRGDADLRSFEVRLKPVQSVDHLLPGMQVRFNLSHS